MRKFLAALAVAGAAVAVVADDKKPDQEKKPAETKKADEKKEEQATQRKREKKEPTLKVGDKAPTLTADKWLQGEEVKAFASGKIYVVEFWATWCGPCIVMMPHMAEMQAEFKDKGVTFIGYTKKDPNNSEEKVTAFVKKRGPKLGYTFAYDAEPDVYEAWMTAAGQGGIPCCFVVDRTGNVAYIGHPMYLDIVLPKVVDGAWKYDADAKALDAVEQDVNGVFAALNKPNAEEALKTLAAFEKKYPTLNKIPYFVGPRLTAMLKAKKYDDAKIAARNYVSRGIKEGDDALLGTVASAVRGPEAKGQKDLLDLGVKAAEEALKLAGDGDLRALMGVAGANFAAGNAAKGKEYAAKAVAAAEERVRPSVGMNLAGAAIAAGDKASGVELAEKAIEAAPAAQKGGMMTSVAGYFVTAGDKPAGEEWAKKAIDAATPQTKAGVYSALARIYLVASEKKAGDDYAKKALEAAGSEQVKAGVMVNLAQAYYAAGEKGTARDYAQKAIENAPPQAAANYRQFLQRILNDPEGKPSDK
jgi:thiol-disulfide isomerase/thioredoxin